MSKLIDMIKAKQYENSRHCIPAKLPNLLSIKEDISCPAPEYGYKYSIGVTLGFDKIVLRSDEVETAKTQARRQIREFVFGEFRQMAFDIEEALYRRDIDDARIALHSLLEAMLGEEK